MNIKSSHLKNFIKVYVESEDLEYTLGIAVLREIVFTFDGKVSEFVNDRENRNLDFSMNVNNYDSKKSKGLDVIDSDLVSIKIDGKEQTKINSENYECIYMAIRNVLAHNIVESIDYSTQNNSRYSKNSGKRYSVLDVKKLNNLAENQFTNVEFDCQLDYRSNVYCRSITPNVVIAINTKDVLQGRKDYDYDSNYQHNNQNLKEAFIHLQELMLQIVSTVLSQI